MSLKVRVHRFDPSKEQAAHFETFHVPIPFGEKWSVLDALDYIHFHLDSSLSYYRHSSCNRGVCARCVAQINGKASLLCEYIVPADGEILLEPPPGKKVAKDLVGK